MVTGVASGSGSAAVPIELSPPAITGSAEIGLTLTASPGAWSPEPDSLSIQWEDCPDHAPSPPFDYPEQRACVAISGATGDTYTVTSADAGTAIAVYVTWTSGGSTGGDVSEATLVVPSIEPLVPSSLAAPQVAVGNPYTVVPGTWTGNPTSYSYQWLDCKLGYYNPGPGNPSPIPSNIPCTVISGASGLTYAPTSSDDGFDLVVEEWATNGYGTSAPVVSQITYAYEAPPGPVPVPPPPPTISGLPAIAGATTIGSMLTASPGPWVGAGPITYSYQWDRCTPTCQDVTGATQASYTLTDADLGQRIEVLVTATNAGGSWSEGSPPVGPITEPPLDTFSATAFAQARKSLAIAIVPSRHSSLALLRRGGWSASIPPLPAGKLRVWWSVSDHQTVELAAGRAELEGTGGVTIRLALTRRARSLLRSRSHLHVRAEAIFAPATGSPLEVVTRFTLSR